MHAASWTWRDCKPSHIFVHRGTLRFIDFEGACRNDETEILSWGSPDYVHPRYHGKSSRRAGTLEDDYALGVIAFQFLSGKFPPAAAHRRAAIYQKTGCPKPLREKIDRLLSSKIFRRRVR
jgi:serine/threonine protein kinase